MNNEALQNIDTYIAAQSGWQRNNLVQFRHIVHEVLPQVEEAWKWMVPVFLVDGHLVCAMSVFKDHTKFNFFKGASLLDDAGIFNNGLDSKTHRAVDLSETDAVPREGIISLLKQVG